MTVKIKQNSGQVRSEGWLHGPAGVDELHLDVRVLRGVGRVHQRDPDLEQTFVLVEAEVLDHRDELLLHDSFAEPNGVVSCPIAVRRNYICEKRNI